MMLAAEYLAEHNTRFAREPAAAADYHRRAPSARELKKIFRLEHERTISNDWVVQHDGRLYQLERKTQNYAPVKAKVAVYESQDGMLEVEYRNRPLLFRQIAERPTRKPIAGTAKHRVALRLRGQTTPGDRTTGTCSHIVGRARGRPHCG